MAKGYRTGRLSVEIKKIISEMLLSGVKDPRLSGRIISLTDCEVTSDLSYATCYLTILGAAGADPEAKAAEQKEVLEGLKSASGLFRKEIGRQIKIRRIPELIFKIDGSLDYGAHIDEILAGLDIKPEEPEKAAEEEETDGEA